MAICVTEQCERIATVGKLCKYCYNRNRLEKITEKCSSEECPNKVMAKGLCSKHYSRMHYPPRVKK